MKRFGLTALAIAGFACAGVVVGQPGGAAQNEGGAQTGEGGLRVIDTKRSGRPSCAPVDLHSGRFVRGGCQARAYDFSTTMVVRTPFGRMVFADCVTMLYVTLAADGRMWFDNLHIGGPSPCNDFWPCAPPEVITLPRKVGKPPPLDRIPPWRGRLRLSGDHFVGHFRLCYDTCLGRFGGNIQVRMVRGPDGWIMRADSEGVGDSGLEVTAEWNMIDPSFFDLERR